MSDDDAQTSPTDEELMARFVDGDERAYRALFERYSGRLMRMFLRSLRNEEDARDLLQQTFLHLHRARKDFREGATLRPWLYTIALNLKRGYFRRRSRKPETPLDLERHPEPAVDPAVEQVYEHAVDVRRAVAELPESQRVVIELHWFDGLPFKEVAETLGISLSATKVRAHRGYKRLRESLSEMARNL